MGNEDLYADLLKLKNEKSLSKNNLLEVLKEYSSKISVFELMNMITYSDSTFEGVSDKWKKLGNEMQVKTFIERIKSLNVDDNDYEGEIDSKEFEDYINLLRETQQQYDESLTKDYEICILSIVYANFILEEPIHPEGTEFPGSGKVFEKDDEFYCPARDANDDNPKAFCRLCIAYQS